MLLDINKTKQSKVKAKQNKTKQKLHFVTVPRFYCAKQNILFDNRES